MKFFTNLAHLFNLSSFSIQFHTLKLIKNTIHPNSLITFLLNKLLSISFHSIHLPYIYQGKESEERYRYVTYPFITYKIISIIPPIISHEITSDTMFNGESRARKL